MGAANPPPTLTTYRDLDGHAPVDLALERTFMERAAAGRPILFSYSWTGPVVVLGYGQKDSDVDLEWCRARGVGVYRRATGGTGVVHRRDLALSLFLPMEHPWSRQINGMYARFLGVLVPVLNRAGGRSEVLDNPAKGSAQRSPICFEDQLADTLVADGRKVVGCAQARKGGAVLIHAAISLNLDVATYAGAFRVIRERIEQGLGDAVPGGSAAALAPQLERAIAAALEMETVEANLPESLPRGDSARGGRRWIVAEIGGNNR